MALKRRPDQPRQRAFSAATANMGQDGSWRTFKFGNNTWQKEGWRLYDIVPELRFIAGWIGGAISQAELYVTRVDLTGEDTGRVTDPDISRLAAEPLGTGSQRDDNMRLWGIDLAVPGEAWAVGENAATGNPDAWYVVTSGQIERNGQDGDITVNRPMHAGGGKRVLDRELDVLIRSWMPHPDQVNEPDSPTRSALPVLREIELVTKREFAELDSRLVGAGIWPLPDDADFPKDPNVENAPEGLEGFVAQVQRVASLSMQDQSSAVAHVPIMFTTDDPSKIVAPIRFWSEIDAQLLQLKESAIRRLAAAFETPSEILTGIGDANHWTAWAIGEDAIKRIQPYLTCIADALTHGFLIPALTRAGIADPESYAYAFDVAPLAVRPNRLADSIELADRGLLRGKVVVEAGGFDPLEMPTEEERIREAVLRAITAQPALLADPSIQAILGVSGPAPAEVLPTIPDTIDDGPPQEEPLIGSRMRLPMARLMVMRALELAGGRLTTPADRRGRWSQYPRHELHSRVGPVTPDKADKVLDDAWTHLPDVADDLGIAAPELQRLLHGYCHQLLVHGQPHDDSLLNATLRTALS